MSKPLLSFDGVWFSYEESSAVLRGIDLQIGRGEAVALVGQNGSGKTTLAKHMNGLLHPDRGTVRLDGRDTREAAAGELAAFAGYVFQNPDHQIFSPTVEREIAFGPENLGVAAEDLGARVEEAIERFGLEEVRDRHPTLLGRGLRRRVAIASIYALGPELMVLDEPTVGLDRRMTLELLEILQTLIDEGRTVVLISHDMRLVGEFAGRLIVMHEGQIIGDGPVHELLPDQPLMARASLTPPEVTLLSQELEQYPARPAVRNAEFVEVVQERYRGRKRGDCEVRKS